MDYEAGNLQIEGNNYSVKNKKRFEAYASIIETDKKECFDFAFDMSYRMKGEHRDSRSGGSMHRTKGQIFINTFQGKMAEFALYRFFRSKNIQLERPDVERHDLGVWDSFDLDCQGKSISVKSTKYYGNLLLLEKKDWDDYGRYKPNISNGTAKYDYTMLVRFQPDGEEIMRENCLLFQRNEDIPSNILDILVEKVYSQNWLYDFPGFIYHSELVKMIQQRKIIPKNAMLNGRVKMDAENYYFQTGNMHSIVETYTKDIKEISDERAELRFLRQCPKCGENLVLRHGYNWFWGCTGYVNGCSYTEPIESL